MTYVLLTCPRVPGPAALRVALQLPRLWLARAFMARYRDPMIDQRVAEDGELKMLDPNMGPDEVDRCRRLADRRRRRRASRRAHRLIDNVSTGSHHGPPHHEEEHADAIDTVSSEEMEARRPLQGHVAAAQARRRHPPRRGRRGHGGRRQLLLHGPEDGGPEHHPALRRPHRRRRRRRHLGVHGGVLAGGGDRRCTPTPTPSRPSSASSRFEISWGDRGENAIVLEPWDFVHVPKGVVRTFKNVGDVEGALFVIIQGNRDEFNDVVSPPVVVEQLKERSGADVVARLGSGGTRFFSPSGRLPEPSSPTTLSGDLRALRSQSGYAPLRRMRSRMMRGSLFSAGRTLLAVSIGTCAALGWGVVTSLPTAARRPSRPRRNCTPPTRTTGLVEFSNDITLADCTGGSGAIERSIDTPVIIDGHGFTLTQTCPDNAVVDTGTGALTVENLTITGGQATGSGGGISAQGGVILFNTVFRDNHAGASGGGLSTPGVITIESSTVDGNNTPLGGAGVASATSRSTSGTPRSATTSAVESRPAFRPSRP